MLFSPVNITFLIQKPEKSMKKLPLNSQVMDMSFYPTKKKQLCNHTQIWFAEKNGVPGLSVHRFKDTVISSLDWVDSLKLSWEKLNQAFFNPIIKLAILAAFNLWESIMSMLFPSQGLHHLSPPAIIFRFPVAKTQIQMEQKGDVYWVSPHQEVEMNWPRF